ncbi:MAG: DUF1385 domain-containing protein, partial [Thermoleophilia bacterium]|nr:DUF1385 domain-containing protein [Thermoleophilia bacterium]
MSEKVRLGGMALANGVLVHGPNAWACAVRADDGAVKVASGYKSIRSAGVERRLLQGPVRIAEVFALLPRVRRALPEARLPFERPGVLAAMAFGTALVQLARRAESVPALAQELVGAAASLAPAALAMRGSELAAYHGAEHISIGTYEHDEPRQREHERCGTHLVGPLLTSVALANAVAAKLPAALRPTGRAGATLGAVAVSMEVFGWMVRHPENPIAKALARPGREFQRRFATAEPTPQQLEVAEVALAACLE